MSDIPVSVDDYERLARAKMDPSAFDYYAGGSGQERTLGANRSAFDAIQFRPRVLVDVSHIDLATTVLGQQISFPVMLAPTAFNRLACDDGEMAAARAAGASGTLMISSTLSTCTLEDVAHVATGPLWFQLYVYKDRGGCRLQRACSDGRHPATRATRAGRPQQIHASNRAVDEEFRASSVRRHAMGRWRALIIFCVRSRPL
jgi:4-hydroxymandelate oxidase